MSHSGNVYKQLTRNRIVSLPPNHLILSMCRLLSSLISPLVIMTGVARADVQEAAEHPEYRKVSGVSGNLNSTGSDTLNKLMNYWQEGFTAHYPNVTIQVEGKGSATAPPALIQGAAQIGPMSRVMKAEEIDAFERRFRYKPTEIKVCIDTLAIYAHKDNPIKGLSFKQLDSIFSSTRKRGGPEIREWGQLGVKPWQGRPISLYGRNSASGTYGIFQTKALKKGDFKANVKEQPGSSAVVQGIGADLYALGYASIGYRNPGVRALPVAGEDGVFYEPSYENALSGDYPMARFLSLYVNKQPGRPLDKLTLEFLKYVLSREGQAIVRKDGHYPVPAAFAQQMIDKLGN